MTVLKHQENSDIDTQKNTASEWFENLRNQICNTFEDIEVKYQKEKGISKAPTKFERKKWSRNNSEDGGGGVMSIMRGHVFEKVGVNISTVYGTFSPTFQKEIPGCEDNPNFWASGISLVAHMKNPHVPAVHMNTRYIVTTKSWFGGGADLTPTLEYEKDTKGFHQSLKNACDQYSQSAYKEYKEWCDRYFYIPHRKEPRGVGGIFYDNLASQDWDRDFHFTQNVGKSFLDIYPKIVQKRMFTPWTEEEKTKQLIKRGRYVEFNLLYDRGTKFGLQTGGNEEAILMSLPPEVNWP